MDKKWAAADALGQSARVGCANFTSDNTAGVMPEVMVALQDAVRGTAPAYGGDAQTARLNEIFSRIFETEVHVFIVATGTAANSLALGACCRPYSAVLCHEGAHIMTDEAGAPEFFTHGAKLLPIAGERGKFSAAALREKVGAATRYGDYGGVPAVVSVTQARA